MLSLGAALLTDYSHYRKVTLSAFNFLYFNVLSQQSAFFGEEPAHYLMFVYLPKLLSVAYPFFFVGVSMLL